MIQGAVNARNFDDNSCYDPRATLENIKVQYENIKVQYEKLGGQSRYQSMTEKEKYP